MDVAELSNSLRHLHAMEDGHKCYDPHTGVYYPAHELYDVIADDDEDAGISCTRCGISDHS